jgi:CheY-like chemotaxis protein
MPNTPLEDAAPEQRPVVLVVEDEPLVRIAAAEGLRDQGFEVLEARDADEAVVILDGIQVDAVFSDITMPGKRDGIGLAKWLRQHRPSTRIVLTSGALHLPAGLAELGPLVDKPYRLDAVADRLRAELLRSA